MKDEERKEILREMGEAWVLIEFHRGEVNKALRTLKDCYKKLITK